MQLYSTISGMQTHFCRFSLKIPVDIYHSIAMYSYTSALRLLALRGLRTRSVRRVALWAPGVTQSKLFLEFFSFIYIL